MDIEAVMDELAERLASIPDLRVYAWSPGTATPPAAIVGYPTEYRFDDTYQRGLDTMSVPVVVLVGRTTDRTARTALAGYVAGSGPASVKATLERTRYASASSALVTRAEFDAYDLGGVSYLAAIFDVIMMGKGR
jgi:hypothetical protein